jgi:hypothetical protein
MKKILYWGLGTAIILQFIRPDFYNPKVDEAVTLHTDAKTMGILKTSCYDCHSNETAYPWYHNVAPLSWVISSNIEEGRAALNFSHWEAIDANVKLERLERAKKLIRNEMMPKSDYLLMHENAVLTNEDKKMLEQFFDSQIEKL